MTFGFDRIREQRAPSITREGALHSTGNREENEGIVPRETAVTTELSGAVPKMVRSCSFMVENEVKDWNWATNRILPGVIRRKVMGRLFLLFPVSKTVEEAWFARSIVEVYYLQV